MEAAQSRQKSYADKRRRLLSFKVGDYVYLKVSPMKKVQRFGVKRKLAPRYVGPYMIIGRSGPVAYKLELPESMRAMFNVFHVSQLKKFLRVPDEAIDVETVDVQSDLTYEERLVQLLETSERVTHNNMIKFYKVVWNNHAERDATWEREDYQRTQYRESYKQWYPFKSRDEIFVTGRGCNTPRC